MPSSIAHQASAAGSRRMMLVDLDSAYQATQWGSTWHAPPGLPGDLRAAHRARARLHPVGTLHGPGLEWFTGVLRAADLFSDAILVTSAQLLDGIFFLALGPGRVHALLGRDDLAAPVLRVVGPEPTLEQSLQAMLADKRFHFSSLAALGGPSSIADQHRADIAAAAPTHVVEAVVSALRSDLTDALLEDSLDDLARSWQGWIDAEHDGLVSYESYRLRSASDDRSRPDPWDDCVGRWRRPDNLGDAGERLANELATMRLRSEAHVHVAAFPDQHIGQRVYQWYLAIYFDYLARNNDADWIDVPGGPLSNNSDAGVRPRGVATSELKGDVVGRLGSMPVAVYQQFCFTNRHALAEWRARGDDRSAEKVSFGIQQATQELDYHERRRELVRDLALALLVAIVLFVIGAVQDSRYLMGLAPILGLVITLAAEVLKAFGPLWELRRSATRSTIYLTATRHS